MRDGIITHNAAVLDDSGGLRSVATANRGGRSSPERLNLDSAVKREMIFLTVNGHELTLI